MILKPTPKNIRLVRAALKKGGVVALPTETFYALCANACDKNAVEKIIKLKGRSSQKGVSIILKNKYQLSRFLKKPNKTTKKLIDKFWPGPLSLIFENKSLPKVLEGSKGSILARMSPSKALSEVLRYLPFPITATSANISGKGNPKTPSYIAKSFKDSVNLILDVGRLRAKKASTIVDARGKFVKILRDGSIPAKKIVTALE